MRRHKFATACLSTCLVIAVSAATGAQAAFGAQAARARAVSASPTGSRQAPPADGTVLLINGDRLAVTPVPGGRIAIADTPATPRQDALVSVHADSTTEEIPVDVLPYLGHGLAPSLFNVPLLRRAEVHGRLPVRVTFRGPRPSLPGVTVTSWGDGSAAGYLTARSAKVFGAALARRFRLDQASGRYGSLFAGNATIAVAGAARPATQPARSKYTLTVTGTNLSGKPDSGDVVWVLDADDPSTNLLYQGTLHDGSATFSVPTATYWVIGQFSTTSATGGSTYLDALPQVTVKQNTTVHTAALAATSEVTMVTPRPAKHEAVTFQADFTGQHGKFLSMGWYASPGQIWVDPMAAKPSIGTLQCLVSGVLIGTAAGITPYVYNLDYADAPGTIPPQRYVVAASSLATMTDEYYEDAKTNGAWLNFGEFPEQDAPGFYFAPLALPGELIQYYSAGSTLAWEPIFAEAQHSQTGGQVDNAWQSFQPGEHQVVDWNHYPLHPKPAYSAGGAAGAVVWEQPSALRTGNALTVTPYLFGDNVPGHVAGPENPGTKSTVTYTIDQNGVKIASGAEGPSGIPPVTLSSKPSVVTFTFDAAWSGPDYKLSKATRTVWTWRSAPDSAATVPHDWYCSLKDVHGFPVPQRRCSVQSMMTLDYQVNEMHLNGTAPAGPQTIDLSVGHIQLATAGAITGATASASCNGGKSWHKAAVSSLGNGQFRLTFSEPQGCDVTLRTSAQDAAGGSITETITDAYAIAG
jgi:hypothetical protein